MAYPGALAILPGDSVEIRSGLLLFINVESPHCCDVCESGMTISQEDIAILCSSTRSLPLPAAAPCTKLNSSDFGQNPVKQWQSSANLNFQRGSIPPFHPRRTQNRSPLLKVA